MPARILWGRVTQALHALSGQLQPGLICGHPAGFG